MKIILTKRQKTALRKLINPDVYLVKSWEGYTLKRNGMYIDSFANRTIRSLIDNSLIKLVADAHKQYVISDIGRSELENGLE